eukprot:s3824_g2.t1
MGISWPKRGDKTGKTPFVDDIPFETALYTDFRLLCLITGAHVAQNSQPTVGLNNDTNLPKDWAMAHSLWLSNPRRVFLGCELRATAVGFILAAQQFVSSTCSW